MFYAMVFLPNGYGGYSVRAIRAKPYKALKGAIKAVQRKGEGYVHLMGKTTPVWTNVTTL